MHDLSHPHLQNIKKLYIQIFQVTLMSSTHVCLLVIRVYLIGPSFVTFQECFRPHVIGLRHLAFQALWPSVIEPICLQRCRKCLEISEKKSARTWANLKIHGHPIGSKVWHIPKACNFQDTVKTQDSDVMGAIDAKHCETFQIFSKSRCSRHVEITFERNFEPSD